MYRSDFRPTSAMLSSSRRKISLHNGCHVGVDGRRAHPLVLFELRQNLVRERDWSVRQFSTNSVADSLLVFRVGVGVEETHGHRVDIGILDAPDDVIERPGIHMESLPRPV